MNEREDWNSSRFQPADAGGHYESWFQRANHPSRPQAFWIRYTIFSPKGRPQDAVGELWAVYFDGEAKEAVAFAFLGWLTLNGQPGNVPGATGARGQRVLGRVTPA